MAASLNAFCSKFIAAEAALRSSICGCIKRREVILTATMILLAEKIRMLKIRKSHSHLMYFECPVSHSDLTSPTIEGALVL